MRECGGWGSAQGYGGARAETARRGSDSRRLRTSARAAVSVQYLGASSNTLRAFQLGSSRQSCPDGGPTPRPDWA